MLPKDFSGGPHGLGDPENKHLRHVEKDILIAVKVRDRTKAEKCVREIEEFNNCWKKVGGFLMIFKCRQQTKVMNECLVKWYQDEDFRQECTEEYLRERSEYRRTGLTKKERLRLSSSV